MHPRQRSPRGFYATSDYRHLNRDSSFSRPHPNPKPFSHPPPPPPPPPPSSRRLALLAGGDIFVEAGRLAAEYLVSQGLLPPNALSFKWQQNNSFKKHAAAAGGAEFPVEGGGRTSALARLGNSVATDGPSGRRKTGFDDFGQKGNRRRASFRGNGLDWGGREFRRNGSWSDRSRYTPERKDNDDADADDTFSRHKDEAAAAAAAAAADVDDVLQKPKSDSNETGDILNAQGDNAMLSGESMVLKQTSSGDGKDKSDVDVEQVLKSSNVLENASPGVMDVKDATADDDAEKSVGSKNLSVQSSDQDSIESSRPITDLLSLFKSIKVPTKPRSLRGHKNFKADPQQNNGAEDTHDAGNIQGPQVLAENASVNVNVSSSGDLLSDMANDSEHLESNMSNVEPDHGDVDEDLKELDNACNAEEDQSIGTHSGQDLGYMHDDNREPSATLLEHGSCSSMAEERGEKRVAEVDDLREESKRVKEWLPSLPPTAEGYFQNMNAIGMKEIPEEDDLSHIDKVTMTSDQGSLMSTSQFTEVGDRSILHCSEEKQSLPSSFRTCDLNLIEASEVHENQTNHPLLIYPHVSETKKAVPVDIDLTVSRTSVPGKFSTQSTNGKEIEVIDLECDSTQEEKPIDNMERKSEAMFSGLEGFSNHVQSTADIHDVQDGYGLMLSELLGADFPNCSSVSTDINSVHNEMGLHNGTVPMGTLAEDDSIYMSLGEIPLPLGFLRPWEQPPSQDYQKPF